jgi:predicted ribonuclease toxin of YeeF-YezG toxin-antitoxin module
VITTIQITEDKNLHVENYLSVKDQITDEEKSKLNELLKKIKINISKGEYDLAKNLIVEGLAIDKFNVELNMELA